jgi:hypothetical protein
LDVLTRRLSSGDHFVWRTDVGTRELDAGDGRATGTLAYERSALLTPTRCTVYGAPDAAVQQALAGLHPVVLGQAAGFHR